MPIDFKIKAVITVTKNRNNYFTTSLQNQENNSKALVLIIPYFQNNLIRINRKYEI